MHGLNQYDSKARMQEFQIPHFTTRDPLCEKYYDLSPYGYCAGNPMIYVDPDGKDLWDFLLGFGSSIGGNLSLGVSNKPVNNLISNANDYNVGRDIGDVISIGMGVIEAAIGGGTAGGGTVATVGSVGTTSPITVPVTAAGVGLIVHGTAVAGKAVVSLMSQDGRVSQNEVGGSNTSSDNGVTESTVQRKGKGRDGATSKHIIEKDSQGNTISKTHQVNDKNGNVIHQHQDFVPQNRPQGEKATMRQFPDEWVKYPKIEKK